MSLIAPPPVLSPGDVRRFATADVVVPGGEVYHLPPWWPNWLRPRPVPVPPPTPLPTPPVTPQPAHPDAAGVIAAMNHERVARGLSNLVYDVPVTEVAQYWSQYQALHSTMTHGPGSSFATRVWSVHPGTQVGECVAEGATTAAGVVAMWLASPPHRAIIMGDFTACGAGVAYGRNGTSYWTADFFRSR